jgi:hypothetical protein
MNTDLIRFKRRLSDPDLIEFMSDIVEYEMQESEPCNYKETGLKGWLDNILDGSVNRLTFMSTLNGTFSESAYDNKELYDFLYDYFFNNHVNRIEYVFSREIDDCE